MTRFTVTHDSKRRRVGAALAGAVALLSATLMVVFAGTAQAATTRVPLGTADSFAVLAGSEVTNTGPSDVTGDLGVHPGTAITGFPPGTVNGTQHSADAVAAQAKSDLVAAYNNAAGRPATELAAVELGGRTLTDGVYHNGTLGLTGTLTLDGQGIPGAVWIFQADSTLITASNSRVSLTNGANACNVFWQVGSSATLGTGTDFVGTVMALASITVQTGASVQGRVLARSGAVTLDDNVIGSAGCPGAGSTPPTTTTTTTEPTTTTSEATTTTTEATTTTTEPTTTTTTTTKQPPVTTTATRRPDGPGGPGNGHGHGHPGHSTTTTTTAATAPGGAGGNGGSGGTGGSASGGNDGSASGGDGGSSTGGSGAGSGNGSGNGTVIIPRGHPETGAGGASGDGDQAVPAAAQFIAAGVALTGAVVAAGVAVRRRRVGDLDSRPDGRGEAA